MARLLVGTEGGLFEVDGASPRRLLDGSVTSLDADGWAVVGRHHVMHRDLPDSWREVQSIEDDRVTALLPFGDGVLVAVSGARLLHRGEAMPGFTDVQGRDEWHAVGSSQPYVRSLTATADGVLLANVHVGGIPRSSDGGASWHPTIDVEADVHEVRAHPTRPELVLAAAAVGLCRSDDGGTSWRVIDQGLHGTYCRALAFTDDAVLVTASTGPFTKQAAVYRAPLADDGPLERVSDWLPHNIDTGCLDAVGDTAAFGDPDGVVHVSADGGRTWEVAADGLPPVTALAYSRT